MSMLSILWNTIQFTQRRLVIPLRHLGQTVKDMSLGQSIPSLEFQYQGGFLFPENNVSATPG